LIYYNLNVKYGSLKNLKVEEDTKIVKSWLEIESEIFKISPDYLNME